MSSASLIELVNCVIFVLFSNLFSPKGKHPVTYFSFGIKSLLILDRCHKIAG
ncbi:hypothetical protein BD65_3162 [Yersinia ruckeri]|nr:hypothetical protein BD65_3162 [Yersinia ruckeri]